MWPRGLRPRDWRQRCLDHVNARVLDVVRAARPDVFLCVKGVQLRPETIRAIGRLGATTVGYWIDDPLDHARSLVNAELRPLLHERRRLRRALPERGHHADRAPPERG